MSEVLLSICVSVGQDEPVDSEVGKMKVTGCWVAAQPYFISCTGLSLLLNDTVTLIHTVFFLPSILFFSCLSSASLLAVLKAHGGE